MLSQVSSSSTQDAYRHLIQAACEHDFRAELKADPAAALARLGLEIDPAQIPAHVELPAVEVLRATPVDDLLEELRRFFAQYLN